MFTVVEDIIKSDDPIPGPVKAITGSSDSLLLMREAVTAEENGRGRHGAVNMPLSARTLAKSCKQ